MKKSLVIIGASGHGKVVADIAEKQNRYDRIFFLDDDDTRTDCAGFPVVGTSGMVSQYLTDAELFVAIGNAQIRQRIQERLEQMGEVIPTLIHPNAVIGKDVSIGPGTVVMAGAVINPCAQIGKGCIINTCSSIDHDCRIGDYVHVAVGAHLCGTVVVGEGTWIGAGATVSNNLTVCGGCMIGAGAVVVNNIAEAGTYIGVPAKIRK